MSNHHNKEPPPPPPHLLLQLQPCVDAELVRRTRIAGSEGHENKDHHVQGEAEGPIEAASQEEVKLARAGEHTQKNRRWIDRLKNKGNFKILIVPDNNQDGHHDDEEEDEEEHNHETASASDTTVNTPTSTSTLASLSEANPSPVDSLKDLSLTAEDIIQFLRICRDAKTRGTLPTAPPAKPRKIPRPPNSFMTYRQEKQAVVSANTRANNKEVSRIIGLMWKQESEETKEVYRRKAREAKEAHMKRFPGYKYTPRRVEKGGKRKKSGGAREGKASRTQNNHIKLADEQRSSQVVVDRPELGSFPPQQQVATLAQHYYYQEQPHRQGGNQANDLSQTMLRHQPQPEHRSSVLPHTMTEYQQQQPQPEHTQQSYHHQQHHPAHLVGIEQQATPETTRTVARAIPSTTTHPIPMQPSQPSATSIVIPLSATPATLSMWQDCGFLNNPCLYDNQSTANVATAVSGGNTTMNTTMNNTNPTAAGSLAFGIHQGLSVYDYMTS